MEIPKEFILILSKIRRGKTKMDITKENVVDMARKTEGLPTLLREKGDNRSADLLATLQSQTSYLFEENPDPKELALAYMIMEAIADLHEYDSGKRQFNSI